MESIGQRLKDLIEKKDLSLLAFSEKVGIQRSSLSHLFSGRNKPSIDLLLKIKDQFPETDLEWLITGKSIASDSRSTNTQDQSSDPDVKSDVTYVKSSSVVIDNQSIKSHEPNPSVVDNNKGEIERIIIFYKNGNFKEYKNSQ